ncbi:MAG: DUF3253 domain-containing protein [Pseudomonadota bacterium]
MQTPTDTRIAREILLRCYLRGAEKSICPSEVARMMLPEDEAWRALMPEIRDVAAILVEEGVISVSQKGQPVDLHDANGPIRLRLARTGRADALLVPAAPSES